MFKPYKCREDYPEYALGIVTTIILFLLAITWIITGLIFSFTGIPIFTWGRENQSVTHQEVANINVSEEHYIETNSDVYYVEFEVCNQDNVNETSFVVQVSKTYFDSVEVGDIVNEGFRIKCKGIE